VLKISVPADFQLRSFYVVKTSAKQLLQRHPCRLKQGRRDEKEEDLF